MNARRLYYMQPSQYLQSMADRSWRHSFLTRRKELLRVRRHLRMDYSRNEHPGDDIQQYHDHERQLWRRQTDLEEVDWESQAKTTGRIRQGKDFLKMGRKEHGIYHGEDEANVSWVDRKSLFRHDDERLRKDSLRLESTLSERAAKLSCPAAMHSRGELLEICRVCVKE